MGRPTAAASTVLRAGAQGHADAELFHPVAHVVGGDAEDAGHRQHRREQAHDTQ